MRVMVLTCPPQLTAPEGLACVRCAPGRAHLYVASMGRGRLVPTLSLLDPFHEHTEVCSVFDHTAGRHGFSGNPWRFDFEEQLPWALEAGPDPRHLYANVQIGDGGNYEQPAPTMSGRILCMVMRTDDDVDKKQSDFVRLAVPGVRVPLPLELNRPSDIAFSRCGGIAYVATFCAPDVHLLRRAPRKVLAYAVESPNVWRPLESWADAATAQGDLVHAWGLTVHPRNGNVFVTSHGALSAAEDAPSYDGNGVIAELCGRTGVLLHTWTHEALRSAAPNSLTFL